MTKPALPDDVSEATRETLDAALTDIAAFDVNHPNERGIKVMMRGTFQFLNKIRPVNKAGQWDYYFHLMSGGPSTREYKTPLFLTPRSPTPLSEYYGISTKPDEPRLCAINGNSWPLGRHEVWVHHSRFLNINNFTRLLEDFKASCVKKRVRSAPSLLEQPAQKKPKGITLHLLKGITLSLSPTLTFLYLGQEAAAEDSSDSDDEVLPTGKEKVYNLVSESDEDMRTTDSDVSELVIDESGKNDGQPTNNNANSISPPKAPSRDGPQKPPPKENEDHNKTNDEELEHDQDLGESGGGGGDDGDESEDSEDDSEGVTPMLPRPYEASYQAVISVLQPDETTAPKLNDDIIVAARYCTDMMEAIVLDLELKNAAGTLPPKVTVPLTSIPSSWWRSPPTPRVVTVFLSRYTDCRGFAQAKTDDRMALDYAFAPFYAAQWRVKVANDIYNGAQTAAAYEKVFNLPFSALVEWILREQRHLALYDAEVRKHYPPPFFLSPSLPSLFR